MREKFVRLGFPSIPTPDHHQPSTLTFTRPWKAKARNPDLKVVISLRGWTFSDPGPWQDISPSFASKKENTLISNLLGFLSQYDYEGVGKYHILSCRRGFGSDAN